MKYILEMWMVYLSFFFLIFAKLFEALIENFIYMEKHSLKADSVHNEGNEILWFKKHSFQNSL